ARQTPHRALATISRAPAHRVAALPLMAGRPAMDPAIARPVPADGVGARVRSALRWRARPRTRLAWLAIAAALLLIPVLGVLGEMHFSILQALVFSTFA